MAVVTGANHGIGAAIAKELAWRGYRVAMTWLEPTGYAYRNVDSSRIIHTQGGQDEADRVLREITTEGGEAVSISADLSKPDEIIAVLEAARSAFGPVDTLINNAAHAEADDTIEATDAASIDRTFSVNVRGSLLLIQTFLRQYREAGLSQGAIVNISTNAAQCDPFEINYGSSKAAVEAFTRGLCVALGPYGVRVNAVAPGPVHTGIPKSYITPELEQALIPRIPLGRCGQPEDIARAVRFLVSDDAQWISGQVLTVDGGHTWGRCQ
ncbi:3-oxoacyl-[acyl-carrier-protein] reductase FabG [Maioricimonas rarisocia]|uniref:3-oxoacyl-[acyl-carrier-protein] reductase FabG n=1 Tax=Maioricimonas rarisocia TaxID=2528026 RepID=A0A517ZCZ6_9PLAN|nr:3-oxoacyl-[acyl-carrier-protein] reductase FabG [Maioricimonas rarisocia]